MKHKILIAQFIFIGFLVSNQLCGQKLNYDWELNIIYYDIYLKSSIDTRMAEYHAVNKINIDAIAQYATKFLSLSNTSKKTFLDYTTKKLLSKEKLKKEEYRALQDIHSFLSEEEYFSFWKGLEKLNNQENKSEIVQNICLYIDAIAIASGFDSLDEMIEKNQKVMDGISNVSIDISTQEGLYGDLKEKHKEWFLEIEGILCPPNIDGKEIDPINYMKGVKWENKMAKLAYLSSLVSKTITSTYELEGYGLEVGSKSIAIVAGGIGCIIGISQLHCGSPDNNCTETKGSYMDLCVGLSTEECMKIFYSNRSR